MWSSDCYLPRSDDSLPASLSLKPISILPINDPSSPSYDVYDDVVPIDGDEDSPFLGFEYFEKNIQAMDSKIVEDSSFAPLPNKDIFKEFIDVSHIEAVIKRLWIQSVAHKTYGRSITAPTHPI
ncbi:hypothetical protein F2Q69_00053753 [Brassica cretica]|uniref:Uncharacterized protein n=1 Tax=Brassica cretica TaxID=69181 RepID=A0A8S9MP27_BRACR|nr:hypothetical protein F2Q69_00053753 [Brassica cretica]